MAMTANRQFWLEFIRLYKSLPALWKIKCQSYHNKELKSEAYELMVYKLREIDENATRETVKKKINILRTNYRKALRAMKEMHLNTKDKETVSITNLWYFDEIDFLRDQEIGTKDPIIGTEDPIPILAETSRIANKIPSKPTRGKAKTNTCSTNTETQPVKKSTEKEIELLSQTWSLALKNLPAEQQIFARKAINDILFEAQLGALHRNSVQINQCLENKNSDDDSKIWNEFEVLLRMNCCDSDIPTLKRQWETSRKFYRKCNQLQNSVHLSVDDNSDNNFELEQEQESNNRHKRLSSESDYENDVIKRVKIEISETEMEN